MLPYYDSTKPLVTTPRFRVGDFVLVGNRNVSWKIKFIANTGFWEDDKKIGYWFDPVQHRQHTAHPVFESELRPSVKGGDTVEILNLNKEQTEQLTEKQVKVIIGMKFSVLKTIEYPKGTLTIILKGFDFFDSAYFSETQLKIIENDLF